MRPKSLNHKPLVETILEFKWRPNLVGEGPAIDADLRLFLGKLRDLIVDEYSAFEVLGTAAAPEQLTPNLVQYRFRKRAGGWPLVQIGSGILTLNETAGYLWGDFEDRANRIFSLLFERYPSKPIPLSLELRYINAINLDFDKTDVFSYLSDRFNIGISLPQRLFEKKDISSHPNAFALQTAFKCGSPPGNVHLRLSRASANNLDAIVWETIVRSEHKELPALPAGFSEWLKAAHAVAEDWFFKLVEGKLLKQFE
jgi:uncharacterized protein (TIGR04255 family)